MENKSSPLTFWRIHLHILLSPKSKYMGHVTASQRYTIDLLLRKGYTQTQIANLLDKCKSVVCREILRNKKRSGEYCHYHAQKNVELRRRSKQRTSKLTDEIKAYIKKKLKQYWSPEQISNVGKKEVDKMVCVQTIYDYIALNKIQGGKLYKYLRRQKRYRTKKEKEAKYRQIKNRVNISKRPKEVDDHNRFGDLEVDLILGSNKSGVILTMNDRTTGMAKLRLVKTKQSKAVMTTMINALNCWKSKIKTITSDNGLEFTNHRNIAKRLEIDYYFCDPYCSWQRGANENLNGLVRQFFPKGTSFNNITPKQLNKIENLLNNRPRKRYNFKSPKEQFNLITKVAFKTRI